MKSTSYINDNYVLLVDDEEDITSVLKQGLEKQGFRVTGFTDPLLALEHFRINFQQYGFVISDLRMPGMNGYEFVKKARKIKQTINVFIITAFEIDEDEFRNVLQSVKIDEIIRKPISFKSLAQLIQEYNKIQIGV